MGVYRFNLTVDVSDAFEQMWLNDQHKYHKDTDNAGYPFENALREEIRNALNNHLRMFTNFEIEIQKE